MDNKKLYARTDARLAARVAVRDEEEADGVLVAPVQVLHQCPTRLEHLVLDEEVERLRYLLGNALAQQLREGIHGHGERHEELSADQIGQGAVGAPFADERNFVHRECHCCVDRSLGLEVDVLEEFHAGASGCLSAHYSRVKSKKPDYECLCVCVCVLRTQNATRGGKGIVHKEAKSCQYSFVFDPLPPSPAGQEEVDQMMVKKKKKREDRENKGRTNCTSARA